MTSASSQMYIPESFLERNLNRVVGISRLSRLVQPDVNQTYGSSNSVYSQTVRFTIPNSDLVMLNTLRFQFTGATSINTSGFINGLEPLIKDVKLIVDGRVCASLNDTGLFAHIWRMMTTSATSNNTLGQLVEGYRATLAIAKGNFAGKTYSLPIAFEDSFINQDSLLPCFMLGKVQIEIGLEPNVFKVVESDASLVAPTYTVSNAELHYDILRGDNLESQYIGKPYSLKSIGVQSQDYTITTTNTAIQLSVPFHSVRGIFFVMRDTYSQLSNQSTVSKEQTFGNSTLASYSIKYKGEILPANGIKINGVDDTREMLRLIDKDFGSNELNSWWLSASNITDLHGYSFQSHYGSISGADLVASTSPMFLMLNFTAMPATALLVNIWIMYDTQCTFGGQNYKTVQQYQ
jgi:hypothetical protein